MTEDKARRGGCSPAHHVLIGSADVGGDNAQDDSVRALATDVLWVDTGTVA
jgi:hypothetical protein